MLLDMCKAETPLSVQDRISAIMLEVGGAMTRDSLLSLLSTCAKRSRLDEVLGQMRRAGLIGVVFTSGHKAIYFLTADGAAYSKKLLFIRTKVRYGQAAVAYALTVEELLMRFVRAWGLQGWEIHGQYEASDEIAFYRQRQGVSAVEVKKTTPTPSAFIRTKSGKACYIAVDCHYTGKRVFDEMRRYATSLFRKNGTIPGVLFVAATSERAQWMRSRVIPDPVVKVGFCSLDQAVDVLEGTMAPIR
ncbi:hypothetical protein [Alicyclobacillus fodiniaquatilis]|uniref:Protein involved in plasmid replication-relaxation n=1 Tax=Alicyclobacillus fodiniaquatilis TaxID=1661150 RepID=A0ABW4JN52_9BACL